MLSCSAACQASGCILGWSAGAVFIAFGDREEFQKVEQDKRRRGIAAVAQKEVLIGAIDECRAKRAEPSCLGTTPQCSHSLSGVRA